jgi:hypothetical protein
MIIAEQLGHMYGFIKHYTQAADMFRVVLKLAWVLQDANMEIKAYHHLSKAHFQMGNMEKSKYYLIRSSGGLLESDMSRMKNSVLMSYKDRLGDPSKHKKSTNKVNSKNLNRLNEPEILPSPSNDRHQCDKNKSMFVFSGIYYSKKDKERDFKSMKKDIESESSEGEEQNEKSWVKGKYNLLFTEDKFLLKRKTFTAVPKPR